MQQAAQQQMQQIIQTPPDGQLKPLPGAPHLIDPQAASSAVPLPMLDGTGQGGLGAVLDAVAADVVAYRCRVHIEVRRDSDYPLVSDQLLARVKKLSPDFDLHLSHVVQADKPTRLILTPELRPVQPRPQQKALVGSEPDAYSISMFSSPININNA